jgi:hypothetical protein
MTISVRKDKNLPDHIIFFHTVDSLASFLEEKLSLQAQELSIPKPTCTHISRPDLLNAVLSNQPHNDVYAQFNDAIKTIRTEAPETKIMVTCSSLGLFCDQYRAEEHDQNLLCIDRAMMKSAAKQAHKKIALITTNDTTKKPSKDILNKELSSSVANPPLPIVETLDIRDEIAIIQNAQTQNSLRQRLAKYDGIILAQVSIGKAFDDAGITLPTMVYKSYDEGLRPLLKA